MLEEGPRNNMKSETRHTVNQKSFVKARLIPKPEMPAGSMVTLAFRHWSAPKGHTCLYLGCRRDQDCLSGFKARVRFGGETMERHLDLNWFNEFVHNFQGDAS